MRCNAFYTICFVGTFLLHPIYLRYFSCAPIVVVIVVRYFTVLQTWRNIFQSTRFLLDVFLVFRYVI